MESKQQFDSSTGRKGYENVDFKTFAQKKKSLAGWVEMRILTDYDDSGMSLKGFNLW